MNHSIVLSSLLFLAWPAAAQSHSASEGAYTKEQAKRGQAVYLDQCGRCHADNMGGGESAPALMGDPFLQRWKGMTVADLFERILHSMPSDNPDSLSPKQVSELVAHILSSNGFPAGQKELSRDVAPLKEIRIEAKP
jgi:mono/diheme cytochrome c family protein